MTSDADYIYEAACSGMRYTNPDACGEVAALWIGGTRWPVSKVAADDDEPVTEEWLRSVGFTPGHLAVGLWLKDVIGISPDLELECVVCNARPRIKTKSDVRRLCAALGIPLPSTNEEGKND